MTMKGNDWLCTYMYHWLFLGVNAGFGACTNYRNDACWLGARCLREQVKKIRKIVIFRRLREIPSEGNHKPGDFCI